MQQSEIVNFIPANFLLTKITAFEKKCPTVS